MEELTGYDIPEYIWEVEQGDAFAIDELEKIMDKAQDDENSYFEATTAMIHLEEAANSISARDFNFLTSNNQIKIVSHSASKIKINITVKKTFNNCFYLMNIFLSIVNYRISKNTRKDFRTRNSMG